MNINDFRKLSGESIENFILKTPYLRGLSSYGVGDERPYRRDSNGYGYFLVEGLLDLHNRLYITPKIPDNIRYMKIGRFSTELDMLDIFDRVESISARRREVAEDLEYFTGRVNKVVDEMIAVDEKRRRKNAKDKK